MAKYEPVGEKINVGDTTAYHVGDSNKVLIIVSDIFGATSGRHESIADTYAKFGYNVYLPEVLPNPYTGTGENMGSILENIKGQSWEKIEERFAALLEYLTNKGYKNFFCVGFCWGVWASFKLAVKFEGFIAIAGFHPSLGICQMFGENEKELVESIKCPAFLYPASNDPPNIKTDGELIEILKKRFGDNKVGTHEFKNQVHGWVVRGDI